MILKQCTPIRESVPVEAGIVADIATGKMRSRTLDAHYNLLEECMNERRARKKRKTRLLKLAWTFLLAGSIATGSLLYLKSREAQQLAVEPVRDVMLGADRIAAE